MDDMSKRILDHQWLIAEFRRDKRYSTFINKGISRPELDSHLQHAIWQTLEYRDTHDDPKPMYWRFWWYARGQLKKLAEERVRGRGAVRDKHSNIKPYDETPEHFEYVSDRDDRLDDDVSHYVTVLDKLESLTPHQQQTLTVMAGAGSQVEVAKQLGVGKVAVHNTMRRIQKVLAD